jgi:acyl carrier protein
MTASLETLCRIVAEVLELPATAVDAGASSATLPEWDSLRNLQVVLAVEGAFGVRFRTEELPALDSVRALGERLEIALPPV